MILGTCVDYHVKYSCFHCHCHYEHCSSDHPECVVITIISICAATKPSCRCICSLHSRLSRIRRPFFHVCWIFNKVFKRPDGFARIADKARTKARHRIWILPRCKVHDLQVVRWTQKVRFHPETLEKNTPYDLGCFGLLSVAKCRADSWPFLGAACKCLLNFSFALYPWQTPETSGTWNRILQYALCRVSPRGWLLGWLIVMLKFAGLYCHVYLESATCRVSDRKTFGQAMPSISGCPCTVETCRRLVLAGWQQGKGQ